MSVPGLRDDGKSLIFSHSTIFLLRFCLFQNDASLMEWSVNLTAWWKTDVRLGCKVVFQILGPSMLYNLAPELTSQVLTHVLQQNITHSHSSKALLPSRAINTASRSMVLEPNPLNSQGRNNEAISEQHALQLEFQSPWIHSFLKKASVTVHYRELIIHILKSIAILPLTSMER